MRALRAAWIGSFGVTLIANMALIVSMALMMGMAASWAQTVPSAGANALDQATPDSPSTLLPASGLTLDGPVGFDQTQELGDGHPRPSEGLGLQIYDSHSASPSGNDGSDQGDGRNP
jgi:hypothetical protein